MLENKDCHRYRQYFNLTGLSKNLILSKIFVRNFISQVSVKKRYADNYEQNFNNR
jgi:hypothetical protein